MNVRDINYTIDILDKYHQAFDELTLRTVMLKLTECIKQQLPDFGKIETIHILRALKELLNKDYTILALTKTECERINSNIELIL